MGHFVWPTIVEENGTTRKKKYEELSVTKKLQADCDLKATNIALQGLLSDVLPLYQSSIKLQRDRDREFKLISCLKQGLWISLSAVAASRFPLNQQSTLELPIIKGNQTTIQDDLGYWATSSGMQGQKLCWYWL
ncbi:hypothetical protein Tco_1238132 [Tanacetum coccineum]